MTKANSLINDIIIIWNIYECGHNLYVVCSLCLGCSQHVLCTWALVWTHAEKIFFQTYAQNGIIETYAHCVTGSPGIYIYTVYIYIFQYIYSIHIHIYICIHLLYVYQLQYWISLLFHRYSEKVILFGGPFILREEKCHLLSDFPDRLDGW